MISTARQEMKAQHIGQNYPKSDMQLEGIELGTYILILSTLRLMIQRHSVQVKHTERDMHVSFIIKRTQWCLGYRKLT